MDRKTWTVDVEGAQHLVALDWTYYGGHRRVSVDHEVVADSTVTARWRSEQTVDIDGHRVVVRTRPARRLSPYFVIELELDGRPVAANPGRKGGWEA
ncbi:MAG TPA: hypothetical protein VFR07_15440 [Mycobacteriales bacterium]|jgi:hypothetical protein|nr:hypothetical protein [Mycobacteriales bacterium]